MTTIGNQASYAQPGFAAASGQTGYQGPSVRPATTAPASAPPATGQPAFVQRTLFELESGTLEGQASALKMLNSETFAALPADVQAQLIAAALAHVHFGNGTDLEHRAFAVGLAVTLINLVDQGVLPPSALKTANAKRLLAELDTLAAQDGFSHDAMLDDAAKRLREEGGSRSLTIALRAFEPKGTGFATHAAGLAELREVVRADAAGSSEPTSSTSGFSIDHSGSSTKVGHFGLPRSVPGHGAVDKLLDELSLVELRLKEAMDTLKTGDEELSAAKLQSIKVSIDFAKMTIDVLSSAVNDWTELMGKMGRSFTA